MVNRDPLLQRRPVAVAWCQFFRPSQDWPMAEAALPISDQEVHELPQLPQLAAGRFPHGHD
jgi:hypothetical protein